MNLTLNFNLSEFTCKCGCDFPDELLSNIKELAKNIQVIRNTIGVPIKINSGYRCEKHNRKEGGKPKSMHIQAKAGDLKVKEYTPKELYNTIKELMDKGLITAGGLKAYNTFVHYDIRGKYCTW